MNNKDIAIEFLNLIVAGKIDEAYEKFVDMNGRHHNAYYPAGFAALKEGMIENHAKFPEKKFEVKQMVAEGDKVAVYSHVRFDETTPGIAVMHLLRFENGKIAEMWDCGQAIPADSPNTDGIF